MATRFAQHLLGPDDHASRPAFGDVPQGTLYSCTDHGLIYQSDGATAWITWATLGGSIDWGETGDITDQNYDDVADAGALNEVARADHLHGMPSAAGGGGGNAPDGKPWNHSLPAAPEAEDDEFNDDTNHSGPINGLDSKWSLHNLGTASWRILDDETAPGCLALVLPAGQAADQHIYQAIPSFSDYVIEARFSHEAFNGREMWGINILDTSGNGVGMSFDYTQLGGMRMMSISSWGQTASVVTQLHMPMFGVFYHMWLRKSGSTYTAFAAPGDRIRAGTAAGNLSVIDLTHAPSAFTPAYITFGRTYTGGGTPSITLLDFFRVKDET